MTRIAVTGRPGRGKSTLCRRLVAGYPGAAAGILTGEVRDDRGRRVGFELVDIGTGARGILAHVDLAEGPRVGRYRVNLADLEGIGVPALEGGLATADLLVIDELAPMELCSRAFAVAVERALAAPRSLLVAFQQRLDHPLVTDVRRACAVHTLTVDNREAVYRQLRAVLGARETAAGA